jgi:hypothetical protein
MPRRALLPSTSHGRAADATEPGAAVPCRNYNEMVAMTTSDIANGQRWLTIDGFNRQNATRLVALSACTGGGCAAWR